MKLRIACSFDDFVGVSEDRRRRGEAERLCQGPARLSARVASSTSRSIGVQRASRR
jgi:hypothetical protein